MQYNTDNTSLNFSRSSTKRNDDVISQEITSSAVSKQDKERQLTRASPTPVFAPQLSHAGHN